MLLDDLPPGGVGKAELRGHVVERPHTPAARRSRRASACRVERVDGLTLWLRAE